MPSPDASPRLGWCAGVTLGVAALCRQGSLGDREEQGARQRLVFTAEKQLLQRACDFL